MLDDAFKIKRTLWSIEADCTILLGGEKSTLKNTLPEGLIGELESLIKEGRIEQALKELKIVRKYVGNINTGLKDYWGT